MIDRDTALIAQWARKLGVAAVQQDGNKRYVAKVVSKLRFSVFAHVALKVVRLEPHGHGSVMLCTNRVVIRSATVI